MMSRRNIIVMVNWNHWQNGAFKGVLMGADFDNAATVESPYWDQGIKAKLEGSCVVLGGKNAERFVIKGHKEWVGSWCWDGLLMAADEAARLLNWLVCKKGFRPDYAEEHLWESIEQKREVSVWELLEAIGPKQPVDGGATQ